MVADDGCAGLIENIRRWFKLHSYIHFNRQRPTEREAEKKLWLSIIDQPTTEKKRTQAIAEEKVLPKSQEKRKKQKINDRCPATQKIRPSTRRGNIAATVKRCARDTIDLDGHRFLSLVQRKYSIIGTTTTTTTEFERIPDVRSNVWSACICRKKSFGITIAALGRVTVGYLAFGASVLRIGAEDQRTAGEECVRAGQSARNGRRRYAFALQRYAWFAFESYAFRRRRRLQWRTDAAIRQQQWR